ncbi:MAG TPA: hypothetical protein VKB18_09895 [Gemmatimonadota bacterium]|nr:hypothetical protein [Gemmatimonadota bacterium]
MGHTRHIGWTWAMAAALLVAACGGKEKPQETTADTTAPAAQAESPADSTQEAAPAPAGQQQPAPKPAARKPAPAPSGTTGGQTGGTTPTGQAGPAGGAEKPAATPTVTLTVETGTTVMTTLDRELSTKGAKVGDAFTATVSQPVSADGRTALPAGATIHGEVTAVQESGSSGQPAVLKVDFKRVTVDGADYPISADLIDAQPQKKSRTSAGEAAVKIGAGTAAGAILGRIIGGNKTGTFIGAAVGAAAGTAIVLGTQDVDAVLPEGSAMTLKLTGPLTVRRPQ